jgi:hypothetical protein
MQPNNDMLEFYSGKNLIAHVMSSMVPMVGSKISIRGETWTVTHVTYALDRADGMSSEKILRANIDLEAD